MMNSVFHMSTSYRKKWDTHTRCDIHDLLFLEGEEHHMAIVCHHAPSITESQSNNEIKCLLLKKIARMGRP